MTRPSPVRVHNDVYIRDADDRTVQCMAKVYDIDFAAQMAKVGFQPERGRDFSEIHLPEIYRAEVPLAELSLEPHSGAQQKGYAEVMLALGAPVAELAYMDRVGKTLTPGDPVPERALDKTVPVPQVDIPQPDDDDAAETAIDSPAQLPNGGDLAIGMGAIKVTPGKKVITTAQVMAAAAAVVRDIGKPPPLFTKADVLAKCKQLRDEIDKLIAITESL